MKTDFKVAIHIKKDSNEFSINFASPAPMSSREEKFNIGLYLKKSGASACDSVSLRSYLRTFPSDRNQVS